MLWMAVTADRYEFPVYIERSAEALARKAGTTETNVRSQACRHNQSEIKHKNGRKGRYRYYSVKE